MKRESNSVSETAGTQLSEIDAGLHYGDFLTNFPISSVVPKRDRFLRGFFGKLFEFFERYFAVKILISPPPGLQNISPRLWGVFLYAQKLKNIGILERTYRIESPPDEPHIYRYISINKDEKDPAMNGAGSSIVSEKNALVASIAEALERHCFRNFRPLDADICLASYKELRGRALDPNSFAGISNEWRDKGFKRLRHIKDESKFHWVQGRSLLNQKSIWIPWQVVTANPEFDKIIQQEPVIRLAISTGAAVGTTIDEAIYRGILEVVERDAYMITYVNKISPPQIDQNTLDWSDFAEIKQKFERTNLDLRIFRLPTDIPCHAIMAVILPRDGGLPRFTLGFKAELDLKKAVLGAVTEALKDRIGTRNSLRTIDISKLPDISEKDKIGQFERVYLWHITPGMADNIKFIWSGSTISLEDIPPVFPDFPTFSEKTEFLMKYFHKTNMTVAFIENTTEPLRRLIRKEGRGLHSVFVVIPEMQPMHLREWLPYLWGKRMHEVPLALGYTPLEIPNPFPQPFP